MLGGWLHRHTCFVAANTMRGERRRQSRERQAAEMNAQERQAETDITGLAPLVDDAINELDDADRMAILLRFFEQLDFETVGEALGSSEDAARMRVRRALEKLQPLLKRRGVTTTAGALSVALSANAIQTAPVGLAVTISTTAAALAGAALQTSAVVAATKAIAMTTVQKTIIGTVIAAAIGTGVYEARQASILRTEIHTLQQQRGPLSDQIQQLQRERDEALNRLAASSAHPTLTPRLPAPKVAARTQSVDPSADELQSVTRIRQLLQEDKPRRLTSEQVQPYLNQNRRTAASLLAAFRATGDEALLREAMEKYPNDPIVDFAAVHKKDASAEEKRHWLESFKRSAADNALPNYLSALDYFNSGQVDQAVQELSAATGKTRFYDYTMDFAQDNDDVWHAAGYPVSEAKVIASISLELPQLLELKQLAHSAVALADSYRQAGDSASAQMALQMGAGLGERFAEAPGLSLVSQLSGIAAESIALRAMDPATSYGAPGQTAKDRLDDLTLQRSGIAELTRQFGTIQSSMSAQDWISYIDRWRTFGERAAEQWAVAKHGR
jgi:hypothetical protein